MDQVMGLSLAWGSLREVFRDAALVELFKAEARPARELRVGARIASPQAVERRRKRQVAAKLARRITRAA